MNLDIDERKRAAQELRDVVNTIPAIVWVALPDDSNNYVNGRSIGYAGMTAEQTDGSGWQAPRTPASLQPAVEAADKAEHDDALRNEGDSARTVWPLDIPGQIGWATLEFQATRRNQE